MFQTPNGASCICVQVCKWSELGDKMQGGVQNGGRGANGGKLSFWLWLLLLSFSFFVFTE